MEYIYEFFMYYKVIFKENKKRIRTEKNIKYRDSTGRFIKKIQGGKIDEHIIWFDNRISKTAWFCT